MENTEKTTKVYPYELLEYLLDNPKEKYHPIDTLLQKFEFSELIDPGYSFILIGSYKASSEDAGQLQTVNPTSHIKVNIYSRDSKGNLLFEPNVQQGQTKKYKLLGQEVQKTGFLYPLVMKMSVGQVAIVRRSYDEHKQEELRYKDEDNVVQISKQSDIFYFVYLEEEVKTGAVASGGQSSQGQNVNIQQSRSNFDDFLAKKEEAKIQWQRGCFEDAKDLWYEVYKQIKSSISKKALDTLPEDKRAQFYEIKGSCITNVLRMLFHKLSRSEDAISTFLEFSPENDTDIKYLDIGCEILLACNKTYEFEKEVSRIEKRYAQKSPEYVEEFRQKIVEVYRPKFDKKKLQDEQVMRANLQNAWNEDLQRDYERKLALLQRCMED